MPPNFLNQLELEYIDGRTWRVTQTFSVDVEIGVIVVPVGFITDFASIPRVLWNILPPEGHYGKAAVLHDYIYVTGGHCPPSEHVFTKKEADKLFLAAMSQLDVPWYQRYPMYQAVRWFGRGSF